MSQTTTSAPWQFKAVTHVLQSWRPPQGPFDPSAAWEHTYHIHFLNVRGTAWKLAKDRKPVAPDGILKIASAPKDKAIELAVTFTALMGGDQTTARIQCSRDAPCSPRLWELRFDDEFHHATPLVAFKKTGSLADGVLKLDGKAAPRVKRLEACACDWSLFEAAQRWAPTRPRCR